METLVTQDVFIFWRTHLLKTVLSLILIQMVSQRIQKIVNSSGLNTEP